MIRQHFKLYTLNNNNNNNNILHLLALRAKPYSKLVPYISLFNPHNYFLMYVLVFPHLAQKKTEVIPKILNDLLQVPWLGNGRARTPTRHSRPRTMFITIMQYRPFGTVHLFPNNLKYCHYYMLRYIERGCQTNIYTFRER